MTPKPGRPVEITVVVTLVVTGVVGTPATRSE